MRVLIIEQKCEYGHYLNYVKYLIRGFLPLGCEVVVAVPNQTPESAQFKVHLSPYQSRFRLEFIPPREYATTMWQKPSRGYATSMWKMIKTDAHVFANW
jgi:hypothetical protein